MLKIKPIASKFCTGAVLLGAFFITSLDARAQINIDGIWISKTEVLSLPNSGKNWEVIYKDAGNLSGMTANVSDQNSNHDIHTMAAALVCVRVGEFCEDARNGVVSAIGTEYGGRGRWLAVGRNLTAYVIAADLLDLRTDNDPESKGSRTQTWLEGFLTKNLAHNNTGEPHPLIPFNSGSNASAQEAAVYAAIGAYLNDSDALDRVWDAFRTYACDPSAPDHEEINIQQGIAHGWAHDDEQACAINPLGTTKGIPDGLPGNGDVYRIDGAIINDIRRGDEYQWPPVYTQYPWVGMEGLIPVALFLHRAGYPAFEVADQAVLRASEFLWYLREETGDIRWFDKQRAAEIKHLVNVIYGRNFPVQRPVGSGRLIGYTDWTHGKRDAIY
ncbi:MAG: hypothetical protein WD267_10055 [Balneolales bacterium]